MVHNTVWQEAQMVVGDRANHYSSGGFLCIGCLERRLKRPLNRFDFTPAPVNYLPDPWNTERLNDRLVRES